MNIRDSFKGIEDRIKQLNEEKVFLNENELDYPNKKTQLEEDITDFEQSVTGSHSVDLDDDYKVYENQEVIMRGVTKIAENSVNWEFKKSESDPLLLDNNTILKLNDEFLSFISEIKKEFISWNEKWDERLRDVS